MELTDYGSGSGCGYGDGFGYGEGFGSGSGSGSGYGYGYGSGSGYGEGSGCGVGVGYGFGFGCGVGVGSSLGSGLGSSHGSSFDFGSGFSESSGSGFGYITTEITIPKDSAWRAYHYIQKTDAGYRLRSGLIIQQGDEIHEDGIEMCERGLHASLTPSEAELYAPSQSVLTEVLVWGKLIVSQDKLVATDRKLLKEI